MKIVFFSSKLIYVCLGNDHEGGDRSMDDDDDDDDDDAASVSDRSSRGNSLMKQTATVRWDYRVI